MRDLGQRETAQSKLRAIVKEMKHLNSGGKAVFV